MAADQFGVALTDQRKKRNMFKRLFEINLGTS